MIVWTVVFVWLYASVLKSRYLLVELDEENVTIEEGDEDRLYTGAKLGDFGRDPGRLSYVQITFVNNIRNLLI